MRIRIHPETTDGKPIPGTGKVIAADTPTALVELMRLQTPFTAEMHVDEYCDDVLLRLEGPDYPLLPETREAADAEFLTRLAQHRRIEFLPEDLVPEEPESAEDTEATPCADK